jgi:hypothetical protein
MKLHENVVINIVEPPRAEEPHVHRPAWLVDGGVACGTCGVRLR